VRKYVLSRCNSDQVEAVPVDAGAGVDGLDSDELEHESDDEDDAEDEDDADDFAAARESLR